MKPGETVTVKGSPGQGLRPGMLLEIVRCLTLDSGAWGFGDYELRTADGCPVWLYRREVVAAVGRKVAA